MPSRRVNQELTANKIGVARKKDDQAQDGFYGWPAKGNLGCSKSVQA